MPLKGMDLPRGALSRACYGSSAAPHPCLSRDRLERSIVSGKSGPSGEHLLQPAQRLLILPEEDFHKLAEILSGADPQSFPRRNPEAAG